MQKTLRDAEYFPDLQTQTGWGRVLSRFHEWIAPQPGWLTLDIGCGPGLFPALLARQGCRTLGIDIDLQMFTPTPLGPEVTGARGAAGAFAVADVIHPPFPGEIFDLVTASNLLFLLSDPQAALQSMAQLLRSGGQIATLNPSEHLTVDAATALIEERGLSGLARQSLLNWAARAEAQHRWSEVETTQLFAAAGLALIETRTAMGPGFARFARAIPC